MDGPEVIEVLMKHDFDHNKVLRTKYIGMYKVYIMSCVSILHLCIHSGQSIDGFVQITVGRPQGKHSMELQFEE